MNGNYLNKLLELNTLHALYREDGKWYHHLKKFPGVLFDTNGYLIFQTIEDYINNSSLIKQKDLHIINGLSSLAGYQKFNSAELEKIGSFNYRNNKLDVSDKAWKRFLAFAVESMEKKDIFYSPKRKKNYFVTSVNMGKVVIQREEHEASEIGKRFFLRAINDLNDGNGKIDRTKIVGHVAKISAIVHLLPELDWADNFETILITNNFSIAKLLKVLETDIKACEAENSDNFEGTQRKRLVSFYERKPHLRAKAILIHGITCKICKFNFKENYGEHGEDYIEVHHLIPISKLVEATKINPETDMTVLCANCHRMVHRKRNQLLSIVELTRIWSIQHSK